ncbi:MAG: hypothetical protein U0031_05925 [Thermomicrobiales bacterium]
MVITATPLHRAAARRRAVGWLWSFSAARVLVLLTLFLLPVQMRAGGQDIHPHALLTLLLDLRDGTIDHHAGEHHDGKSGANHAEDGTDLPDYGKSNVAGSVAMLAAIIMLLVIPSPPRGQSPALVARWQGRIPVLEPPPPRVFAA